MNVCQGFSRQNGDKKQENPILIQLKLHGGLDNFTMKTHLEILLSKLGGDDITERENVTEERSLNLVADRMV